MEFDFFKAIEFKKGSPKAGKLLISEPFMFDFNFKRTVILIAEHNDEGSIGFILNRPSEFLVKDIIPEFPSNTIELFVGGPVGKENLFFIHTANNLIEGGKQITDNLWWGGNFEQVTELISNQQITDYQIRFFLGYSGWASDQLLHEIEENSWLLAKMKPELIMTGKSPNFWKIALSSMGDKYKIMAGFPEDPSKN